VRLFAFSLTAETVFLRLKLLGARYKGMYRLTAESGWD
jgi:hypothetical protein